MALRCGADAVFELPTLYALRDAQRFAMGGVALLNAVGVVTHLGFGSETGDLDTLKARAFSPEDTTLLKAGLAKGETLARARAASLGLPSNTPNDTLAMEYLRALWNTDSSITPVVIKRHGSGYHDNTLRPLASATAIRTAVRKGIDISGAMPEPARDILLAALAKGAVQQPDGLDTALLYLLRTTDAVRLSRVADIAEGLENSILRAAQTATGRNSLVSAIKSKRYTHARLSRIVTQALLGITKELAAQYPTPGYARLLGFKKEARPLMATIRKSSQIPIVTRAAKYRAQGDAAFALDIRAGSVWSLGLANEQQRGGYPDLIKSVIII